MSHFKLTKTRFQEGLWQGLLTCDDPQAPPPDIVVSLREMAVPGVRLQETETAGHWGLEIPVPAEALGDGVQCFLIRDGRDDEVLGSFTLIAGEALGDDIRAEMDLLRAELDMLKRAFRRHCKETA